MADIRTYETHQTMRSGWDWGRYDYQPHDADKVAALIGATFPGECKGEIRYQGDGGRYEIRAILGRPIDVRGDVHRAMICLRSADNGTSAQRAMLRVYRLRCKNGLYVADTGSIFRAPHVGDPARLREQVAELMAASHDVIERFAEHWGIAMESEFRCRETGRPIEAREAIARLVMGRKVHVPYAKRPELVDQLIAAYNAEPEQSVAGVLNSVTRLAHERSDSWKSKWYQEDLEEQAGELLYNRAAWALPPLSDDQKAMLD